VTGFLFVDDYRLGISKRIEMTNDIYEGSITGGSGISDNDSIRRLALASGASKSDFYHDYRDIVDVYIMHYPERPVNAFSTISCQKEALPL
jgi:hypothetical protein